MRLSKQSRSKKGRVAPMSDDDDNGNDSADIHETNRQTNVYLPRQDSRGVSFSTSRGKIWLILIVNLGIVTTFIFMSSSRFPSLSGEGVVNDALEQDHQHPGPVIKNADQAFTLAAADLVVTEAPRPQESRPGGYTKLTSTDHPETPREGSELTDETRTEIPVLPSNETPAETHAESIENKGVASNPEPTEESETQEASVPVSDAEASTDSEDNVDTPSIPVPTEAQLSPVEVTETIEDSLSSSSNTLPPPLQQQPLEEELLSTVPVTTVQAEEALPEFRPASNAFFDNLSVWLAADSGVEVENVANCLASSGDDVPACGVNSWTSQIVNADYPEVDSTVFHAASSQQKPVWVPIVPDTYSQLPVLYFSCPMTTETLTVHESMTFLFVILPAQVETGDSYAGQKFFGNSPYGQFALHGGKPSFFANNGLIESDHVLPVGQFALLTYRLHSSYVEIKVNGEAWGGESPVRGDTDARRVRITVNELVSLGNSKSACDTNAFQGRIAEVLAYNAVLDDATVETVEKYLHGKWWGGQPFPQTTAAALKPDAVTEAPLEEVTEDAPTLTPVVSEPDLSTETPHQQDASDSPATDSPDPPTTVSEAVESESPSAEEILPSSPLDAPAETIATETEATAAPKFDPRINIFEWKPPSGTSAAKAQQWTRIVKEKVDFIRNFQLGGDVLRALIRQHRDELLALREELFN